MVSTQLLAPAPKDRTNVNPVNAQTCKRLMVFAEKNLSIKRSEESPNPHPPIWNLSITSRKEVEFIVAYVCKPCHSELSAKRPDRHRRLISGKISHKR